MKINVIREAKSNEVYQLRFNRTLQLWNTKEEAIASAKELIDDSNPFQATICPISKDEAGALCDKNGVVTYCGADL